jgi:hypothetical protein
MPPARMGALLQRITRMTKHDVEEILHEQLAAPRRFGQIAVELGLCEPRDVWTAWCAQLTHSPQPVDLHEIGVDTTALSLVPADVARTYGVVPVRAIDDQLILATTQAAHDRALAELPALLRRQLKFVIADGRDISMAIAEHYEPLPQAI